MNITPIAYIETDFADKFGVPRQSGLVPELSGRIVFEPEYRVAEAFRGLEGYSHIWLLWHFSEVHQDKWSPTVRPPRLGGNKRVGVFATRSPFRPNPIGLSCVALERVELDSPDGPVLWVRGADLMDGTPIYDIKPYLPFTDSHAEAKGGFSDWTLLQPDLEVSVSDEVARLLPPSKLKALERVLAEDPRPHYHTDDGRVYGMTFAGVNVRFTVQDGKVSVFI